MSHQRVLLLLLSAALLGADRVKVRVRLFAALRQAGRQHAAPPPAATHPPLPRPAGPLAVSPRREVVLRVEVRRLSDVRGTVQPRARDLGRVDVPPAVVLLQPLLLDVGEGEGAVDGGREVAGGGARADDGVRDAARLDPVHLRLQHHPQRLTLLLLVGAAGDDALDRLFQQLQRTRGVGLLPIVGAGGGGGELGGGMRAPLRRIIPVIAFQFLSHLL
eukprot:CAMPEP_0177770020 /NCGR_PEP_ID=MMETSP0491_2-20121128/10681_1 /TAXON_ID=63592 /ORGANISM="Tetraselmis chuii, Strain PLY429" /LENGTH=217 /DNA_ID=CAMNT_0019287165 /DNA_START=195 /DNA_END=848 /DNA_ORIENTATION=-